MTERQDRSLTAQVQVRSVKPNSKGGNWLTAKVVLDAMPAVAEGVELPVRLGDLFSLVGELGDIRAGEVLRVVGAFEDHPRYGLQLKAKAVAPVLGATEQALEAFLKKLPQIGDARARRIIRVCGGREGVIQVLETGDWEKLTQIEGLDEERARAVVEAYQEQRDIAAAFVFLSSIGLGDAFVARALDDWGAEAERIVRFDPYALMTLRGFSFGQADELAQLRLGVAPDDPRRCVAAALMALTLAENEGHTWSYEETLCGLGPDSLAGEIRKRTGLMPEQLAAGIRRLEQPLPPLKPDWEGRPPMAKRVASTVAGRADLIFPAWLWEAEQRVAFHIRRLMGAPIQPLIVPDGLWGHVIPDPVQDAAVRSVCDGNVLVVTGGPGVGKTATITAIVRLLETNGVKTALCAFAGKAADRIREQTGRPATTIHRLLGYRPDEGFLHGDGEPLEHGCVVVDESSMVDVELFADLLSSVRTGARLILVGDVNQLPAIGPGMVLNDVIESGIVPSARLLRIFRQAAVSRIPYVAKDVNEGRTPDLFARGTDVAFVQVDDPNEVAYNLVRAVTTALPIAKPENNRRGFKPHEIQVLAAQKGGPVGTEQLNRALQEALNPGEDGLYIGTGTSKYRGRTRDRVINTRNNYQLAVFNGETGYILAIDQRGLLADDLRDFGFQVTTDSVIKTTGEPVDIGGGSPPIEVRTDGRSNRVAVVDFGDRKVAYPRSDLGDLQLAYAITAHKSQGSGFPCVVFPIHSSHAFMLTRQLCYTVLTRASEFVLLVGQADQVAAAATNTRGARRRTMLRQALLMMPAPSQQPAAETLTESAPPDVMTSDAPYGGQGIAEPVGVVADVG